jgi:spore maturation protein CgeB
MRDKIKLVHLGPEDDGTTRQRRLAFEDLDCVVYPVFYSLLGQQYSFLRRAYHRVRKKLGFPQELCEENKVVAKVVAEKKADIVFVEKGLTLKGETIKALKCCFPQLVFIWYSMDDVLNPGNQSRYLIRALPHYDLLLTTKSYNVRELRDLGAERVAMTANCFSTHVHYPRSLDAADLTKYGANVSFVGGFERERASMLTRLAILGVKVRIWGNNWEKFARPNKNLIIEYRSAASDEYSKIVSSSKIMLGFLRKANRDVITTRSVEIPACGGFLLAERTFEQQSIFREGIEAEYFSDMEELVRKIEYYLGNEGRRSAIAQQARRKCLELNLSYHKALGEILNMYRSL